MKKDQGSLIRIFPGIITTIAVSVLLVFYIGWMSNVAKKDEISQLSRAYMLSMESEGSLSDAQERALLSDLTEKGMVNIDLNGTTRTDVGYGNTIYLHIKGDLKIHSYTTEGFFKLIQNGTTIPIDLLLESTAKN